MAMTRKSTSKTGSDDREHILQEEWNTVMPCRDCFVKDICKWAGSFKRPDFNPEVFGVTVDCKVKPTYAKLQSVRDYPE